MKDNDSFGAGQYPQEPIKKYNIVNGSLTITFKLKDIEFPGDWDEDRIRQDIENNLDDYLDLNSKGNDIDDIDLIIEETRY